MSDAGDPSGVAARRLAAELLERIDDEGAYANLVVPAALDRSGLDQRDRAFVTELVYGVTRRRRACDWLVDRFVDRPPPRRARTALRLGAYQLAFLGTPAHAAVSATVAVVPARQRGFVNAVLRKVAQTPPAWPDEPTRLSYPDWIVDRMIHDLGEADAVAALEAMDEAGQVHQRPDGYIQDPASGWVADEVGAGAGERVLDLCAAPGGKATALAATGARVVAADVRASRLALVAANAATLGLDGVARTDGGGALWCIQADGRRAPFPDGAFDRVLVDAPCSGLGALRRRPDARWRVGQDDVAELARIQVALVRAAVRLARPGGLVVYSACTLTEVETRGVERSVAEDGTSVPEPPASPRWRPWGSGGLVLPQDHGTDGMFVLRLRVLPEDGGGDGAHRR